MSEIHKTLVAMLEQQRDELRAAESALQDYADAIATANSPFKVGDTIADRRLCSKPFAVVEKVFCPNALTATTLAALGNSTRIMVRKIRSDGVASLNVQQLRDPKMYVLLDDEL